MNEQTNEEIDKLLHRRNKKTPRKYREPCRLIDVKITPETDIEEFFKNTFLKELTQTNRMEILNFWKENKDTLFGDYIKGKTITSKDSKENIKSFHINTTDMFYLIEGLAKSRTGEIIGDIWKPETNIFLERALKENLETAFPDIDDRIELLKTILHIPNREFIFLYLTCEDTYVLDLAYKDILATWSTPALYNKAIKLFEEHWENYPHSEEAIPFLRNQNRIKPILKDRGLSENQKLKRLFSKASLETEEHKRERKFRKMELRSEIAKLRSELKKYTAELKKYEAKVKKMKEQTKKLNKLESKLEKEQSKVGESKAYLQAILLKYNEDREEYNQLKTEIEKDERDMNITDLIQNNSDYTFNQVSFIRSVETFPNSNKLPPAIFKETIPLANPKNPISLKSKKEAELEAAKSKLKELNLQRSNLIKKKRRLEKWELDLETQQTNIAKLEVSLESQQLKLNNDREAFKEFAEAVQEEKAIQKREAIEKLEAMEELEKNTDEMDITYLNDEDENEIPDFETAFPSNNSDAAFTSESDIESEEYLIIEESRNPNIDDNKENSCPPKISDFPHIAFFNSQKPEDINRTTTEIFTPSTSKSLTGGGSP